MDQDLITTQITASGIAVWLLQWLKGRSWFPAISAQSQNYVLRIWAAVTAAATAIGLTWTFDPAAGVLTVSGLTMANILHFGILWVKSFAFQELIYRSAAKK